MKTGWNILVNTGRDGIVASLRWNSTRLRECGLGQYATTHDQLTAPILPAVWGDDDALNKIVTQVNLTIKSKWVDDPSGLPRPITNSLGHYIWTTTHSEISAAARILAAQSGHGDIPVQINLADCQIEAHE